MLRLMRDVAPSLAGVVVYGFGRLPLISSSTPSSYVVHPPGLMVGLDGGGGEHPHAATTEDVTHIPDVRKK